MFIILERQADDGSWAIWMLTLEQKDEKTDDGILPPKVLLDSLSSGGTRRNGKGYGTEGTGDC